MLTGKPKPEPLKHVALRAPARLIADVDRAAAELGISRNTALVQLLEHAIAAHRKESRHRKRG